MWGDHEDGVGEVAGPVDRRDHGEGLDGLAEAHVVGEDPAQTGRPEEVQPLEAGLLVRPKPCPKPGWWGHLGEFLEVEQRVDRLLPRCRLLGDDPQPDEFLPESGVLGAEPEEAIWVMIDQGSRLVDEQTELGEFGGVQLEPGAGIQQEVIVPRGERPEERLERDLLTVDGDGDAKVEPVAHVGIRHRQRDRRCLVGLTELRRVAADLDDDVVALLDLRQDLAGELDQWAASQHG